MRTVRGAAWRFALFAAAIAVLLAAIVTAIRQPVDGDTDTYTALFSDVNGLRTGDDVRLRGVAVGQVESIVLQGNQASVRFGLTTSTPLFDTSKLAVRYQNLVGQRYIDVQYAPDHGPRLRAGATVGVDHTVPSFDVTSLFNGLKPVLATLSPEKLNRFTESMLAVIEGNGSGIGPALDAMGELSEYTVDRQRVITTLVHNMSQINDKIGGSSAPLITLLGNAADIFDSLQRNVVGLIDFSLTAPPVLRPADSLLSTLGFTENENPDIEAILRLLIPDPQLVVDVLGRLPAALAALDAAIPQRIPGSSPVCGKGDAPVPQPLRILVAGQRVSICNA
ncbi:phospholipid/cholesterol/gamma-HCH transport system substrate-binding protein [Nocardia transvalensis]|uniref:Phospholipid/cholesterol/gamma-HCH transport system substrate-binding protein n=1 Tax=Nocardia transvalensis TaxID=37333 RepID=A0A7W9PAY6_9NOCA|nr:MlaD family protein [Nocardia transvalensis]MBB5912666.1 phospholipid/cholesterol/gamma-HCH transport system substrate-binding protein [Nocardia transvalensis]